MKLPGIYFGSKLPPTLCTGYLNARGMLKISTDFLFKFRFLIENVGAVLTANRSTDESRLKPLLLRNDITTERKEALRQISRIAWHRLNDLFQ